MSYTLTIGISLGATKAGLTLAARLIDTTGAPVGDELLTGFVEVGNGNYLWTYGNFPDGFRGAVKFYESGQTDILAIAAINPQEVESSGGATVDQIAAIDVDSGAGTLTLAKALEVLIARAVGNLSYNASTGVLTLLARDGTTPVATVKCTGGGNRTESTIP